MFGGGKGIMDHVRVWVKDVSAFQMFQNALQVLKHWGPLIGPQIIILAVPSGYAWMWHNGANSPTLCNNIR